MFVMIKELCEVEGFMNWIILFEGWFLVFRDIKVEVRMLERVVFLGIIFEGEICLFLIFRDLFVLIVVKVDGVDDVFCWYFFFVWFDVI